MQSDPLLFIYLALFSGSVVALWVSLVTNFLSFSVLQEIYHLLPWLWLWFVIAYRVTFFNLAS